MTQTTKPADPTDSSWEGTRRRQLTLGLRASPAQRLKWLEELLGVAFAVGALKRRLRTSQLPIAEPPRKC